MKIETINDLKWLKDDPEVTAYIERANENMKSMGYTEHGVRHATLVANIARNVVQRLGYTHRVIMLAGIAGYLHDIGNVVSRHRHPQAGALLARDILLRRGFEPQTAAEVMAAVGNHEAGHGQAVSPVAAGVILADKSDVHRSRVQSPATEPYDIHDRVNDAAQRSFLRVGDQGKVITLELTIDTDQTAIMDYFEIFLERMLLCRRAADVLDCEFELIINEVSLL